MLFIHYHLPSARTHIPSQSKCCPRGRLVFSFRWCGYALEVQLNGHVHIQTHARKEWLKMDVAVDNVDNGRSQWLSSVVQSKEIFHTSIPED